MRAQPTGLLTVIYAPLVAIKAAPTVAELTGGTILTGARTRDGLKTPASGNTVDISDGSSRFDKKIAGTYGGDMLEMTFYRDTLEALDQAWSTFTRDLVGTMAIGRFGWAQNPTTGKGTVDGTPTAGDRCETHPFEFVSKAMADIADNQAYQFTVQLAVTDEPEMDAVVAA